MLSKVSSKLHIKKLFKNQLKLKVNLFVNLVVVVNMVMYGLSLSRLERGKGFEFVNEVVGGTVPSEFIPALKRVLKKPLTQVFLGGYPVVDVKVTLYDGSYHDVDSSEMAFKIAASMAFKSWYG